MCGLKIADEDVFTLHAYADCLGRSQPIAAADAIRTYLADGLDAGLQGVIESDRRCRAMGISKVSDMLLAGALAEYLIGQRSAPIAAPPGAESRNWLAGAIQCLLSSDQADAAALLQSRPQSKQETIRLRALVGALPACMPNGMELRTHRLALRALLALGAWMPPSQWASGQAPHD